jgi:hypothetical protein
VELRSLAPRGKSMVRIGEARLSHSNIHKPLDAIMSARPNGSVDKYETMKPGLLRESGDSGVAEKLWHRLNRWSLGWSFYL